VVSDMMIYQEYQVELLNIGCRLLAGDISAWLLKAGDR
jgi:hypothetical protein